MSGWDQRYDLEEYGHIPPEEPCGGPWGAIFAGAFVIVAVIAMWLL